MSTPKRASRKTTTSPAEKSPAKKPAKKTTAAKVATKTVKQAVTKKAAKKAAPKKPPAKKTPSKKASAASAKVLSAAQKTAQKVAKKVAKIISKVVAKKKAAKKAATKIVTTVTRKAPKKAAKATKAKKAVVTAKPAATAKKKTSEAKATSVRRAATTTRASSPATHRPKTFPVHDVEHAYGFPAQAPELPDTYGEDRLVLMTKDPEYLFAYWEVTPGKKAAGEKAKRRGEQYREALRLNWTARDIFEHNFAILPVSHAARKWYLRVPFSGLSYQVELGWLGESGHFVPLLGSNPSDAPEAWATTRRRLKHVAAGDVLGRALAHGQPSGSSELVSDSPTREMTERMWDFPGPGAHTSSSIGTKKTPAPRPAR